MQHRKLALPMPRPEAKPRDPMELFVLNDQLVQLQHDLEKSQGGQRWQLSAALAWHLRERDSQHALAIADQLLQELSQHSQQYSQQQVAQQLPASSAPEQSLIDLPEFEIKRLQARAHLVRGETLRLFANIEQAIQAALSSLHLFEEIQDFVGRSDANSLLAWIAMDVGDTQQRDVRLELAAELALHAGDKMRADVASVTQARAAVFSDVQHAMARWGAIYRRARLTCTRPRRMHLRFFGHSGRAMQRFCTCD